MTRLSRAPFPLAPFPFRASSGVRMIKVSVKLSADFERTMCHDSLALTVVQRLQAQHGSLERDEASHLGVSPRRQLRIQLDVVLQTTVQV